MKTTDFLDAVKVKLGLPSDYALQEPLRLSKQQISRYRKGLDTMSEAVCMRVAAILDIDPAEVLLSASLERSSMPDAEKVWLRLLEKVSASADKVGAAAEKISTSFLNHLLGQGPRHALG